nr:transposase (putative), gypsy type [Tanacetum cinerariifolium]
EYLLEFTSEYGISEDLHPELPGPEERIVDFSKGNVGVYTKFFEFANFRLPLSQFLFDILGHYQIYFSQLSVIGAAKVSHFEINCRVLNIVPTMNLFRVFYIPSFNSGWMSFSKRPGKNTPQCYTKPLDSLKIWNNRLFWVDKRVYPTIADWRTSSPKDEMPAEDTYSLEAVTVLNTHRSLIQKQPETLLCLVGSSQRYFLGDDVYPTFLHDDDREMEDPIAATYSFGVPSTIERSHLDFSNENPSQQSTDGNRTEDQGQETVAPKVLLLENVTTTGVAPEAGLVEEIAAMGVRVIKECRKRGNDGVDTNAPPKVLRKDHVDSRPTQSTVGGKSLASMGLGTGSTFPIFQGQVAMGSQLRLRFEQKAKLLKKSISQVARQDQRIHARKNEIKNLEALLKAETAAFEEFKQYEDDQVEKRCAEIDARLDALSIDFDEELYPHMLTAIASRRWVIGHGLRLAVMKCGESTELRQVFADVVSAGIAKGMSEGLKYRVEHKNANLDLEAIEAYDTKYVAALHTLRDLNNPMVDQLESLKDAPIDVIMASLHLESDTGKDVAQWIRELLPSSSQLKIPVYLEVRDPKDPWSFKEEILLVDAIAANVSHSEKKKDVVPTVAPQGLAILLADSATQTETSEDGASLVMYNLD